MHEPDIVSSQCELLSGPHPGLLDDNALKKLRDTQADGLKTGFIRFIINKKHLCSVI